MAPDPGPIARRDRRCGNHDTSFARSPGYSDASHRSSSASSIWFTIAGVTWSYTRAPRGVRVPPFVERERRQDRRGVAPPPRTHPDQSRPMPAARTGSGSSTAATGVPPVWTARTDPDGCPSAPHGEQRSPAVAPRTEFPAGVFVHPSWAGSSPSGRRTPAAVWFVIITLPASFADSPADLLQRRPDLDHTPLGVVLVPLLPDEFTPPGAGMEIHQTQHEPRHPQPCSWSRIAARDTCAGVATSRSASNSPLDTRTPFHGSAGIIRARTARPEMLLLVQRSWSACFHHRAVPSTPATPTRATRP
jgi:hypothetical protein